MNRPFARRQIFWKATILNQFFAQLRSVIAPLIGDVRNLVLDWTKPLKEKHWLVVLLTMLLKTKTKLVVENTLLRQQLIVLKRQVKRPN